MALIHQFKSRYGEPRYVYKLKSKDTYIIEGPSLYHRISDNYYDFEGGPCICFGDNASMYGIDSDKKIISIIPTKSKKSQHCRVKIIIG